MKLNKIVLATVMTMGLGMASVANAADQGQGKITFTGSIVDAPCSITAGSADQTIPLGAISNIALAANGGTGVSAAQPFSIELVNTLEQGEWFSFSYSATLPAIKAVPVKRPGAILPGGAFTSTATLLVEVI